MITYPTEGIENNTRVKAVSLKAISKKYPLIKARESDFWALKDISLGACQGEILGIIGRNGAGKTTLLNIIAGVLSATEGEALLKGRVLGLFNLGVGFQDELTGRENIFLNGAILGFTKRELEAKLPSIIDFSELGDFINMPLGSFSQGMRLRLGFGIMANLDFDILVIDEVLAVGDALFQSKCFQRLLDFKRAGKTLVITSQSMELVERLCDRAALLEHGKLAYYGDTIDAINKYRLLLNTEKFFVGQEQKKEGLITQTTKWANDISEWGRRIGTKEAEIERIELINRFGFNCRQIKSGETLRVKVSFLIKNSIKDAHFGIAIFRSDGVYVYGPNTEFDGYSIPKINPGRIWFSLTYKNLLLAPGEYRLSAVIWDKSETLAYDYHDGCYSLIVKGRPNPQGALLELPMKVKFFDKRREPPSIKLFDLSGEEKDVFQTNEPVKCVISLSEASVGVIASEAKQSQKHRLLRRLRLLAMTRRFSRPELLEIKILRDDGVYCQGIEINPEKGRAIEIFFPKLPLLPGGYQISAGQLICPFRMEFAQADHGTIYLEHRWQINYP